jgi:phosphosulfolactate synthase
VSPPFISLPDREAKIRNQGLTILLDGGVPKVIFEDIITYHHSFIDFVKFGWGTSLISETLDDKINILKSNQIEYFFGGTLFEKALLQNVLDKYYVFLKEKNCTYVEISNGTIEISNEEKCKHIKNFSNEFKVFSEVGYKDLGRSLNMHPTEWIKCINQDKNAGALKVIAEARESGKSGICRGDGEIRFGLIEEIFHSELDLNEIIFEAPRKDLQTYFINRIGPNVNLANISFEDLISLETLRLGLRSDTFHLK